MNLLFLTCLIAVILAIGAGLSFYFFRAKSRAKAEIPEICMGAIRVTDRQGRDMLIIRKDDGSFEMHEEHKIRKQCLADTGHRH